MEQIDGNVTLSEVTDKDEKYLNIEHYLKCGTGLLIRHLLKLLTSLTKLKLMKMQNMLRKGQF